MNGSAAAHPSPLDPSPSATGALTAAAAASVPSGWGAARTWGSLDRVASEAVRRRARESAIDAVVAHARRLVRHASRPVRLVEQPWPGEGELDLERTLEADARSTPTAAPEPRLVRNLPRDVEVVAVLDMSLSMTGEKIALLAVAATILRLKVENVAVVAFDTTPHVLVRAGEVLGVREVARRVLSVPAQGYTNIEGGLAAALEELRRARRRERVGIVFTDGVANVGADPVRVAGRYPRLHVVHLGEHHVQGARCCREMARAGRGKLYRARTYADLPRVVRGAVRELFR